jgi:hypothetical protein
VPPHSNIGFNLITGCPDFIDMENPFYYKLPFDERGTGFLTIDPDIEGDIL